MSMQFYFSNAVLCHSTCFRQTTIFKERWSLFARFVVNSDSAKYITEIFSIDMKHFPLIKEVSSIENSARPFSECNDVENVNFLDIMFVHSNFTTFCLIPKPNLFIQFSNFTSSFSIKAIYSQDANIDGKMSGASRTVSDKWKIIMNRAKSISFPLQFRDSQLSRVPSPLLSSCFFCLAEWHASPRHFALISSSNRDIVSSNIFLG